MQYRNFGKSDFKPSALGFGCMRLPTTDGVPSGPDIDEPEAIRMIRHAIEEGVNYFDTAYSYHQGNSELVLGKALKEGYRDRIMVATKLPVWLVNQQSDFDRILSEQLKKLSTDHIDFYLFHALGRNRWKNIVLKHDLLSRAEAALKDGRIRCLGFSFHDDYESFEEIVNAYDWTFCQIQYNYMDILKQAGTKGLRLAASKGLGVIVMEPLMGGVLVNPPEVVRSAVKKIPIAYSFTELALKWVWDQPEVSMVLSGMSNMEQVRENLAIAGRSEINSLGRAEQEAVSEIREKYRTRITIPCTSCKYCMPCSNGVDIPVNFELFNHVYLYDDPGVARFRYNIYLTEAQRADRCIACRECEEKCPQNIPISEWMPKIDELLSPGK